MRSSERLADPRKCAFRDALPAEVQVCDVKAANGDLRWLLVFSPAETVPAPRGFVLHQRLHQQLQDAIANSSLRAGTTAAFVFGGLRPEGQQPELKFRRAAFSRHSPVLENMDRKIEKRLVEVTLVRRYEVETDPCGRPSDGEGVLPYARFCLSNAWLVQVNPRKRSSCLKSFWATPITLDYIQSSLAQTDTISAIFRKHSHIWL
jgi:hypothetical protein